MEKLAALNNMIDRHFGLGLSPKVLQLLKPFLNELSILINDESDLKIFFDYFWDEKRPLFSVGNFREYVINNNSYTYGKFKFEYSLDEQNALQNLFKRRIDMTFVDILRGKINNGEITLEEIYMYQKQNPGFRLEWLLL
jgi:hypothetical protein